MKSLRYLTFTLPWNLTLITIGAVLFAIGLNCFAIPNNLITGGVSGLGVLLAYIFPRFPTWAWYYMLNIPIFILGFLYVGRGFMCYSLFGVTVLTASIKFVNFNLHVLDPMLGAIGAGGLCGIGVWVALRGAGSCGGTDILGVILNKKLGIKFGQTSFIFNLFLFLGSLLFMQPKFVFYSLISVFVASAVVDKCLGMMNQRTLVFIISDQAQNLATEIIKQLGRGATLLNACGAYTGNDKQIVMTVVHNLQHKRLEKLIFEIDPNAFVIVEKTMNVIGQGFSSWHKLI